jgi:hypothetical protein
MSCILRFRVVLWFVMEIEPLGIGFTEQGLALKPESMDWVLSLP